MKTCAKRYGISVHAYYLMTNHIHFLVTPHTEASISKAMSVICSRYAYYFNRSYKRTGSIWESRHKSSLIQTERYLLTCMRYIEHNPVVANHVIEKTEEYCQPVGDDSFRKYIEEKYRVNLGQMSRGRPKKILG